MAGIQEERPTMTISINELILTQLRDLKEGQRDLNKRMDRIDMRMDRLEEKFNARMDKQDEKIDRLVDKVDSFSRHGQIATISSLGVGMSAVSITLGVLYAILFK
ncbi:MAG: hypothetical protein II857_04920 [Selenomonadaceae bacterium]|nr:hypothetical protein [Selenomonadaceae bacterium]